VVFPQQLGEYSNRPLACQALCPPFLQNGLPQHNVKPGRPVIPWPRGFG